MALFIHWHGRMQKSPFNATMATGQRKDDILAGLIMGVAVATQHLEFAAVVYLVATFIMVWLSRRTKARLDLLKPAK
jgi:hypothetical protein